MVLLYEHWLVTETTLMALVDMVMSVRGAPTTAGVGGLTDTSVSTTTAEKWEKKQMPGAKRVYMTETLQTFTLKVTEC